MKTIDFNKAMAKAYLKDPWFDDAANLVGLQHRANLWWKGDVIMVPHLEDIKQGILYEMHDAPYSGHVGVAKTIHNARRLYWWPHMLEDIKKYVLACPKCQQNKSSNKKPAGFLRPLPIPEGCWESIGMDYIMDLPRTARQHNAVLVFVDRLSKMVHFAPTSKTVTAEGTARLFVDYVWKYHGLPKSIVSDRDTRLVTSHFFKCLAGLLGTKQLASTAYHPQTDGQTERCNRILEDMLRNFVDATHHDWDLHLSAAEFAINNSIHASTGTTPFRMNYGRDPLMPLSIQHSSNRHDAQQFADKMVAGLAKAKAALKVAQDRQALYYNKAHYDLEFNVDDEVLLNTKNIALDRKAASVKFLPKWVGPYKVLARIGKAAYKLELPAEIGRVHPVFHVSLLKKWIDDPNFKRGAPLPPAIKWVIGDDFYEAERIINHKNVGTVKKPVWEFLVCWKDYNSDQDSWEPEKKLTELALLSDYKAYVATQPNPKGEPIPT